jgi:hypothetical protein
MGVRLKQNISVLNVQQWMLKKNLAKKKNNYKGLLLTVIVILTVSLLVGFVKYSSQSSRVAMYDTGFNTAVFFSLHSSSGYLKKDYHG